MSPSGVEASEVEASEVEALKFGFRMISVSRLSVKVSN
ncbi:hypothetical protein CKA32_007055 [Geitlerinema sp. FC II]|nr:hypothetical protein CKA32_007055 [Geitlerinema sp. FC II]